MKKIIKKIFKKFGFEIKKKSDENEIKELTFDQIYKYLLKEKNLIIFDIGANEGQSIERFLKINNNSSIHSFEPDKYTYNLLKEKYQNYPNIKLNNIAIGNQKENKIFNVAAHSRNSSFLDLRANTNWIKLRSKELGISPDNYIKEKIKVTIDTIDSYCEENSINHIDVMKIDTQLFEQEVLIGSKKMIESQKIDAIELEIVFSTTYEKYLCLSDLEKYLVPNNYRFSAIRLNNNNIFSGSIFFANILYLNKTKFNI